MKVGFTILITLLSLNPDACFAQDPAVKSGLKLPAGRISLEGGFNLSLPAHDDLIRTHTLGLGITAMAATRINARWEIGLRAEYDYRFAKKNYPDSVLKFTNKHRGYSVMCLRPGVQYHFKQRYFAGLETGMAYVKLDNDSKTGYGFVEEFDGSTPIGFSLGLYAGKKFNYGHEIKKLAIAVYWQFFYAESHGESIVGLRSAYRFSQ